MPAPPDASLSPAAVEVRVRSCIPLVVHIAKRFSRGRRDLLDEMVAEGNVALVRAARAYRSEQGTEFSTLAYACVQHQVLNALKAKRHRPPPQLPQHHDVEGGAPVDMDLEDPHPDATGDVEARKQVAALLAGLPRRWRRAVELYYGLDGHRPHTGPGVAAALGVSRARAYQILQRALRQAAAQGAGGPSGLNEEGVEAAVAPSAWHSSSC
jgi:RNA polymerase sporulation-specific sigma factor